MSHDWSREHLVKVPISLKKFEEWGGADVTCDWWPTLVIVWMLTTVYSKQGELWSNVVAKAEQYLVTAAGEVKVLAAEQALKDGYALKGLEF